MEILNTRVLRGPSIWTYKPVLEAWVDLGELEDLPSNKLPGFPARLEAWLPTLVEHRCTIGERGGFLKRVHDGTWCGHILEHVTLELLSLAGRPAGFGRARDLDRRGTYKVVVSCPEETLTRACLDTAHELIHAAIDDRPFDVANRVAALRELAATHEPLPSEQPLPREQVTPERPLVFVTGSSGRTAVAAWIDRALRLDGFACGLASAEGTFLDGVRSGDRPGTSWRAARELLTQDLDAAVCEVPPLTIADEGIAFERCLVGVVTDLGEAPELAPFALDQPEGRVRVMRCAVDLVLPEGTAVLNADDPQVADLARLSDGDVLFYATAPETPLLVAHRAAGHRAVIVRDGQIVLASGAHEVPLGPAGAPLAAVAAAWAAGVHSERLQQLLLEG